MIIGQVDSWLAREFAPHRLTGTLRDLAAAQEHEKARAGEDEETARKIAECERKLAQYRGARRRGQPRHCRRVDRRDCSPTPIQPIRQRSSVSLGSS
jgi:hypothetical protein